MEKKEEQAKTYCMLWKKDKSFQQMMLAKRLDSFLLSCSKNQVNMDQSPKSWTSNYEIAPSKHTKKKPLRALKVQTTKAELDKLEVLAQPGNSQQD